MSHLMALRTYLALQVHDGVQQGVGSLNCLGASLETTLGYNHVGELLGQVYVRHF